MVHTHIYADTPRCDSEMIGFIRGKGEGKQHMANGKEGGDRTGRGQIITKRWWETQNTEPKKSKTGKIKSKVLLRCINRLAGTFK